MSEDVGLAEVAEVFRVLGNESRLGLLWLLNQEPRSVGALVEATGLSQPLVSQHLRTLRQAGLITSHRNGREVINQVADHHVVHVVTDTVAHVREDVGAPHPTHHDHSPLNEETHHEHH